MESIDSIIKQNEGIIYKIISKYRGYFELDDLYQVAVIGLIKAYQNYNSTYNTKFISYAYPYILGEVIKYVNEYRSIKLSKTSRSLYAKIIEASQILSQKLMKNPTTKELSLFLEIDESIITQVLNENYTIDSLDKVICEDGKNLEMYDVLGYVDTGIEYCSLNTALSELTQEEQAIINARYYNDLSQSETGNYLGMYQMEVSRKERKILKKLKDHIA